MTTGHIGDLVIRVSNAIIRQEGESDTSVNPGNLRGAPWIAPLPTVANGGIVAGFWAPASRLIGEAGLVHLVALHVAQGNTLAQFIGGIPGIYGGFAPGSDNNKPDVYIKNVMSWAGVPDKDKPMWDYIEEGRGKKEIPT